MNLHKNTRLTPIQRRKIWRDYAESNLNPTQLAQRYRVSRPTIYKILRRARLQEFQPRTSINKRFRCLEFGCKRLARIEKKLEEKLKKQARRYCKKYPGELIHFDTKRLPLLKNEVKNHPREYLFVAIDDYSRELFAAILPDKTQFSSAKFLRQVVAECSYLIETAYSDNGTEYRGKSSHDFVKTCTENKIAQRFTRVKRPQTNGKAERVIRTLLEMWHNKIEFSSRTHRRTELIRFINFYNTVKPHKGIENLTPHEKLTDYFYSQSVNNA
jgi:transposase InsO family protein